MKKLCNIALMLLAFFTTLVVLLCVTYNYYISSIDKNSKKIVEIEIKKGASTSDIAKLLKQKNLIRNDVMFKVYTKLNSVKILKAGYYSLNKSMDIEKIVSILEEGNTFNPNEIVITFKEGLNIRGMASLIEKNTNHKKEEVFTLLEDRKYIESLVSKYWFLDSVITNANIYYPLEGYLYPNTYKFKNKNISIEDIFKSMLDEMDKVLSKYKNEIENNTYSIHEILSLSSIVELEGVSKSDRQGIAGVFFNRLDKKMNLGSDVTTYYAFKVDMAERDLTTKEFNTSNLYNTRGPNMAGEIPVGPICNPSKSSIEAVLNPQKSEYYYFVADKNRKVYFNKTITEHNSTIAKLKKDNLWLTW